MDSLTNILIWFIENLLLPNHPGVATTEPMWWALDRLLGATSFLKEKTWHPLCKLCRLDFGPAFSQDIFVSKNFNSCFLFLKMWLNPQVNSECTEKFLRMNNTQFWTTFCNLGWIVLLEKQHYLLLSTENKLDKQ